MCFSYMCEDEVELSSFQHTGLTSDEKDLLRDKERVVQFWIDEADSHPFLSRVAL